MDYEYILNVIDAQVRSCLRKYYFCPNYIFMNEDTLEYLKASRDALVYIEHQSRGRKDTLFGIPIKIDNDLKDGFTKVAIWV